MRLREAIVLAALLHTAQLTYAQSSLLSGLSQSVNNLVSWPLLLLYQISSELPYGSQGYTNTFENAVRAQDGLSQDRSASLQRVIK